MTHNIAIKPSAQWSSWRKTLRLEWNKTALLPRRHSCRPPGAAAEPRGNQIEATLFDEGRNDSKRGTTHEENSAGRGRYYRIRGSRDGG
jgi:hypothetical protein